MSARDQRIGIVGAGPFGLALANVLASSGREVWLWSQRADVVSEINDQRRAQVLPELELAEGLQATADVSEFARGCRFLVIAVSSESVAQRLTALGPATDGSHIAVHAIGALAGNDERVSRVIAAHTPMLRLGVIAGPSLAADLVAGRSTSLVCASEFDEVCRECRRLLAAPPRLRLYRSKDLVGVELASALSGAYTIAVGLADALDVGIGTRAVLITRAVAEMTRLGVAAGGESKTFSGLAGLGNLLVRTSVEEGRTSPSYQLGQELAREDGRKIFGEGPRAARAGARLGASLGLKLPVLTTIVRVLDGELQASEAANLLVERVAGEE